MSFKVGEFFVELGLKGESQAEKTLKNTKSTLGDLETRSLALKAALAGAMYGMERLMMGSAQTGSDLMSFANATGISADTLQRWQYAGKLFNVSADEMEQSMTNLQGAMVKMNMTGEAPAGIGVISDALEQAGKGGIDFNKTRDTLYMLGKLNEYASTEKNVDFANEQLKSFGMSLNMIAAMRQNAFSAQNLAEAPTYGVGEIKSLQKVKQGFTALHNDWEMGVGRLTAKFGPAMIKDLRAVTKEILAMMGAFGDLAQKTELLKGIGLIFEGWGEIFGLITAGVKALDEYADKINPDNKGGLSKLWKDHMNEEVDFWGGMYGTIRENILPKYHYTAHAKNPAHQTVTTTVHVQGVKDTKDVGHHVGQAVQHAVRQSPSQDQVN